MRGDENVQELDTNDGWAILYRKHWSVLFKGINVMISELHPNNIVIKNKKNICSDVSGSQFDHMFSVAEHQHYE